MGARDRHGLVGLQRALGLLYPPACPGCDAVVEEEGGLCPGCWEATRFLVGVLCDACGAALPGAERISEEMRPKILCDDCLAVPRPWRQGWAAFAYEGKGRDMVLAL